MTAINYIYVPFSAELFSSTAPSDAVKLLGHALNRQKIPGWKFQLSELCKSLGLSAYAVKKARKWLVKNGYAVYERIKFRYTVWRFFPTPYAQEQPSSPRIIKQVEIEPLLQVDTRPGLESTKALENKEQQPEPARNLVTKQEPVVVSHVDSESLIYPSSLTKDQKKAVKAIIRNELKEPAMTQELLFTLAYAIANGHIKSSLPGYFRRLVDAANEGRYTAIERAGATKPDTRHIDKTQAQLEAYRTVNKSEPSKAAGFLAAMRQAVGKS